MITVFLAYSHQDEPHRSELEKHLAILKRQGLIESWHDRRIAPGIPWEKLIDEKLEEAAIVLLLVSPDFLDSDYCYDVEMKRALERHALGLARVVPIILRHCDWQHSPLAKLQALPTDGKPVVKFTDRDEAFLNIVNGIRRVVDEIHAVSPVPKMVPRAPSSDLGSALPPMKAARSSNLRVKRDFSDHDRDQFLEASFEYIANYFENSLAELQARNPGIQTTFKRVDAQRFSGAAYRGGKAAAQCQVALEMGPLGLSKGITYSSSSAAFAGFNEQLSVTDDGHNLYLRCQFGRPFGSRETGEHLTAEGGGEVFWSRFIEPLQQ